MASIEDDLQNLKLRLEMMESEKKSVENDHKVITKQHEKQVEKFKQTNLALKQLIYESRKNSLKGTQHENDLNARKKQDLMHFKIQNDKMQNEELLKEKVVLLDISKQTDKDLELDIEKLKQKTNLSIIKSQEADALRKNFEKLLAVFQDDRNTFDIRMKKLEDALSKKRLELADVEKNLVSSNASKEQWKKTTENSENQVEENRAKREAAINDKKDELHSLAVILDEDNMLIEKDEENFIETTGSKNDENDDIVQYRTQRIQELSSVAESIKTELLIDSIVDLKRLVAKNSDQVRILNFILEEIRNEPGQILEHNQPSENKPAENNTDNLQTKEIEILPITVISDSGRFMPSIFKKSEKLQSSRHKMLPNFSYDPNEWRLDEKITQLVAYLPKSDPDLEVDVTALGALLASQNQRIQFKKKLYVPFFPVQNDDLAIPTRDFLKKQSVLLASQTKQKTKRRK